MASPGLKRGIIQHFIASFEDFPSTCRRDESWVEARVSSLQHFFSDQKVVITTIHPPFNYIPRRKSGIYWIQVRRAAAAAVEISLWTR